MTPPILEAPEIILDHHKAVIQREQEWLEEASPRVAKHLHGLLGPPTFKVAQTIERMCDTTVDHHMANLIVPRPGLTVLKAAFDDLTSTYHRRSARKRVGRIVTSDLLAVAGLPRTKPQYTATLTGKDSGSCSDAEVNFVGCVEQLFGEEGGGHRQTSVYHDSEGEPLIFRKEIDSSTGLLLHPFSFGKATLPAGTIVAVGDNMNTTPSSRTKMNNGARLRTYLVEDKASVRPLRISPWAYDNPFDRALFGVKQGYRQSEDGRRYIKSGVGLDENRTAMLAEYSLADFHSAACHLMDLCDVRC